MIKNLYKICFFIFFQLLYLGRQHEIYDYNTISPLGPSSTPLMVGYRGLFMCTVTLAPSLCSLNDFSQIFSKAGLPVQGCHCHGSKPQQIEASPDQIVSRFFMLLFLELGNSVLTSYSYIAAYKHLPKFNPITFDLLNHRSVSMVPLTRCHM